MAKAKQKRRDDDEDEIYDDSKISFSVDSENLDEEWIGQGDFAYFWYREHANAKLEQQNAKQELDVTKADLDKEIRDDPEEGYGLKEKPTEASITACILVQPEYKAAIRRLAKANHRVDICFAATRAVEHKKAALENLVYLHGQNYFSEPKSKGKIDGDEMDRKSLTKRTAKTREELLEDDD